MCGCAFGISPQPFHYSAFSHGNYGDAFQEGLQAHGPDPSCAAQDDCRSTTADFKATLRALARRQPTSFEGRLKMKSVRLFFRRLGHGPRPRLPRTLQLCDSGAAIVPQESFDINLRVAAPQPFVASETSIGSQETASEALPAEIDFEAWALLCDSGTSQGSHFHGRPPPMGRA